MTDDHDDLGDPNDTAPPKPGNHRVNIGNSDGQVIIDFGQSVHILGVAPDDALNLATGLIEQARKALANPSIIITPGKPN